MKFVACLLVFALLAVPLSALDVSKSIGRLESAAGGDGGICTAVVIADGIAVTAGHCVDYGSAKPSVTFDNRDAEVVRFNKIIDLAVIKFSSHGETPIVLAERSPEVGDEILVAGFPFGIEQVAMQFGHVALKYENRSKLLWLNVELIPGNSGGPALDLMGRLVGINVSIFSQGPSKMGAAVPVETVRDFIKPFLKK